VKTCITLCVMLCCWLAFDARARACSCLPPDMGRSYENADHVVHVRVETLLQQSSTVRRYLARLVEDDVKGCLSAGRRVVIETAANSAACGVSLARGEHLLHGTRARSAFGLLTLRVGLCDANAPWASLAPEHLAFLQSRYVCCGGECACADGSQPVNCFVDPCQVDSCDVEGAVCRANYCGGCNAEWYDASGALVCQDGPPSACNYEDPARRYVARSPEACQTVRFICEPGLSAFFDECGCGCESAAPTACRVGGCSGQLCVGPGEPDITTCEWRDEYACYRSAECRVQANGRCGWTQTPELLACLSGA
jgi:hypothetical protein